QYSPQWVYQALAKNWFALTGIPSVQAASEPGSYSALHPNSKLPIISYKSVFYYRQNFYAYTEPIEFYPDDCLISELQEIEDNNERVSLISHIPTGSLDHFRDQSHGTYSNIDELMKLCWNFKLAPLYLSSKFRFDDLTLRFGIFSPSSNTARI
ncbi:sphingomyelin phosphodiesterase, partial [Aspergillus lentulus]